MARSHLKRERDLRPLIAIGIIVLVAVLFSGPGLFRKIESLFETVSFAIAPSADRAFALGEYHFSSHNGDAYDIDLAEHYFLETLKRVPTHGLVYHELSRIAFLRGNLPQALSLIEYQVDRYGDADPSAYYLRGLIEGYMGSYAWAARDYAKYLSFDAYNWAAVNDYAWVLLKAGRAAEAERVTASELTYFPENAWILNSNAIALAELGRTDEAKIQAGRAATAVSRLTERDWLDAYPGNDPKIAKEGLYIFTVSVLKTMHTLNTDHATSTI